MDKIEIEDFKKAVKTLAESNNDFVFNHKGRNQGSYVLGTIFKHAEDYVKMFVGDFNGAISDNEYYLDNLERFLNRGGKIRVLIQDIRTVPPKAYKLISRYKGIKKDDQEKVIIERINEKVMLEWENEKTEMHFAIADDKMFRIEYDINKYKGVASFNSPDVVEKLNKKFNQLMDRVTNLQTTNS